MTPRTQGLRTLIWGYSRGIMPIIGPGTLNNRSGDGWIHLVIRAVIRGYP
jgi:hypothetical protein